MPDDSDKIRRLVDFKEKLMGKIQGLRNELDETQGTLDIVNSMLLEKGFKRVELSKEQTEKDVSLPRQETAALEPSHNHEAAAEVVPLKTSSGELLAILHIGDNSLHAFPAADKDFSVNTPPFSQFLVERVLAKMQERDNELARAGRLSSEKILSYSIAREGDLIQEISVENVDTDRLKELRSSIRWTLEKMYEKAKTQS